LFGEKLDRLLADLLMSRCPAVQHDAKQPCFAVGAGLKTVKMPPRPQHCVLDEILGDRNIARQAHGRSQQRANVNQRELLKLQFPRIASSLYRLPANSGRERF